MTSFINQLLQKKLTASLGLFIVLFVGFLVRAKKLFSYELWYDEAYTLFSVKTSWAEFLSYLPQQQAPPFYQLLLKVWTTLFGHHLWSVRGFSMVLGMCTLYVLYTFLLELLKKQQHQTTLATIGGLLLAINPFLSDYAIETRPYSLVILLTSIIVFCFYKGLKISPFRTNKWFWGFSAAAGMLLATHYASGFLFFGIVLYYLWFLLQNWESFIISIQNKEKGIQFLKHIGLLCLGVCIAVFFLKDHLANVGGKNADILNWASVFRVSNIPELIYAFLVGTNTHQFVFTHAHELAFGIHKASAILCLFIGAVLVVWSHRKTKWISYLLCTSIVPILLIAFYSMGQEFRIYVIRFFASFGVIGLFTLAYAMVSGTKRKAIFSLIAYVIFLGVFTKEENRYRGYKEVAEFIQTLPQQRVFVEHTFRYSPMKYYLRNSEKEVKISAKNESVKKQIPTWSQVIQPQDIIIRNEMTNDDVIVFQAKNLNKELTWLKPDQYKNKKEIHDFTIVWDKK